MLSSDLRQALEPHTGSIQRLTRLGGGDIAEAFRLDAARGSLFLKQATGAAGASFDAEAVGLAALRTAATGTGLHVPRVLYVRTPDELPPSCTAISGAATTAAQAMPAG